MEDLALLSVFALGEASWRPNVFRWPGRRSARLVRAILALSLPVARETAFQAAEGLPRALAEVRRAAKGTRVFDPFMGAGTIPIEASRLGFTAAGYDSNPNAVLVSRATTSLCNGECGQRSSCLWTAAEEAWRHVRQLWCRGNECIIHILLARCPPCLAPVWVSSKRGAEGPRQIMVMGEDYRLQWSKSMTGITPRDPSIRLPSNLPEEQEGYVAYAVEIYHTHTRTREWVSLPLDDEWTEFIAETSGKARMIAEALPDLQIPYGDETRRLHKVGAGYASKLYTWRQLASIYYFIASATACREEAAALVASQTPTLSLLAFYYQPLAKINPGMVVKSYWIPRNPATINPYATSRLPGPPAPGARPIGRGTLHSAIQTYTRACRREECEPPLLAMADSRITPPPWPVDLVFTDPPYPGLHTYKDTTFFYTYTRLLSGIEAPMEWDEIDPRHQEYEDQVAKTLLLASSRMKPGGLLILLISSPQPEGLGAIAGIIGRLHRAGIRLAAAYPIVGEAPGRLGRADSKTNFILVFTNSSVRKPRILLSSAQQVFAAAGLNGRELEASIRAAYTLHHILKAMSKEA